MYVVVMKHNHTAEGQYAARASRADAAKVAHGFFLGYGFKLVDGRPYDEGNGNRGFDCFHGVKIEEHGGEKFVVGFVHCDGDGPVLSIAESE